MDHNNFSGLSLTHSQDCLVCLNSDNSSIPRDNSRFCPSSDSLVFTLVIYPGKDSISTYTWAVRGLCVPSLVEGLVIDELQDVHLGQAS